jgi:2,4-dienoyl-CoA reductase-like NADH-dependent reductase (Old Yellow Enzyme family)
MQLFNPLHIGGVEVPNRLVMAPMLTNYASRDGFVTDALIDYYVARAKGGAGLIIVEAAGVIDLPGPYLLRIYNDDYVPGLRKLVEALHAEGCMVGLQIVHWLRISSSGYYETPVEVPDEKIGAIIDSLIRGARRTKEAGFDMVEFHGAHSYTLSSFLSLAGNKRKDRYGGSLERRFRIVEEVYKGSREILGDDYPMGIRINGEDFVRGGNTLLHTRQIARKIDELGFDFLDISAGNRFEDGPDGYSKIRGLPDATMPDGVNVYLSADLKKEVSIPVIIAGKICRSDLALEIVSQEKADMVGLGRGVLCDPDIPLKIKEGRGDEIISCKYCNYCFKTIREFKPIECIRWKEKEN